jgi:uncharacterized membrane protein YfcA
MIMLCGAAVGAQVGTVATKYIKSYGIRIAFGLAVVGCMISILMKLIPRWVPVLKDVMDAGATFFILSLVGILSLYILIKMLQGAAQEVRMKKAKS